MASDAVPQTLTQFDAALGAHLGRPAGFADAVVELWTVRQRLTVLKERRSELFAVLREHHARGNSVAGDMELRESRPSAVRVRRTVTAAAIKKVSPELWERSRVPGPKVAVSAPKTQVRPAVGLSLPAVPGPRTPLHQAVAVYQSCPGTDVLSEAEKAAVAQLRTIAEQAGWDGMPVAFSDGWKAGLVALTYDAEALRRIDPQTFEALAVDVTTGGSTHVYLARRGGDGTELDADDGE